MSQHVNLSKKNEYKSACMIFTTRKIASTCLPCVNFVLFNNFISYLKHLWYNFWFTLKNSLTTCLPLKHNLFISLTSSSLSHKYRIQYHISIISHLKMTINAKWKIDRGEVRRRVFTGSKGGRGRDQRSLWAGSHEQRRSRI